MEEVIGQRGKSSESSNILRYHFPKKCCNCPSLVNVGGAELQHFLRKIKDKNLFENTYKKISPCGSKLVTIYSFPKTHKMLFDSDDFPLQPIISSIDTYN